MSKMVQVTREQADKIIEDRLPLGKFYLEKDGMFIAIDNTTGDAWPREFKNKEDCLKWLAL